MTIDTKRNGRLSPDQALALWSEYQTSGDARLRDRLIMTLAPLVKYIVFKKARELPARCDVEDFISCGLEALIASIDRYDPGKGATLEQYAWTRIHGALLDELRRQDWAPRSLRRWERDIARAREQFLAVHRRRPSREELADALATTPDALLTREQEIRRSDVTSLNTLVIGDDDATVERIDTILSDDTEHDPEHASARVQAKELLRDAFSRVPQRERELAVLLYVKELTLREVAEIFGVTEGRVCQLHGQLKRRLRDQLRSEDALFAAVA